MKAKPQLAINNLHDFPETTFIIMTLPRSNNN